MKIQMEMKWFIHNNYRNMCNSCTIQILLSLIPILKQQLIKQINEKYQYIYIYIYIYI